jgi:hypothetical protein
MLSREELTALVNSSPVLAQQRFQLLMAERMEKGDGELPDAVGELIEALGEFGVALVANAEADVPASITNVMKGIIAQVRVATAVAKGG